ncbi:MAG: Gfo/Idh/MocA family oxidoreductase [Anaerolineae bacterium]|nr:Gfo/Idh/MocA family oxidoreductase [Anaerolineae bacterium]
MKPLRIGMIGYGGIGRVHAMGYRAIPFHYGLPAERVQVTGVATSRPETAEAAAKEIGCDFWTADYRALLARDDIDAVDICTPNHNHEEILVAAAAAGKHIYCEKPLAMNVVEGQRIVAAVEQAGVINQMTFNFRFLPALLRARQLLEEGFVGRVFSFRARYYRSSYISPAKPLSWRLSKEIAGGGTLFDLASHVLDLVYYTLGDFGAVQATLETLIKERPLTAGASEKGPVDVDDLVLMHLRMADGSLGLLESSRMGTGATNDLQLEIFGDQGAIRFNLDEPSWLEVFDVREGAQAGYKKLQTVQKYAGQKAPDPSMTPTFARSHAECQYQFLKAIWENRPASPSLADGLKVQELMAAAERSSAEQRWVTVEEVR